MITVVLYPWCGLFCVLEDVPEYDAVRILGDALEYWEVGQLLGGN